jgi:hypothetical protein
MGDSSDMFAIEEFPLNTHSVFQILNTVKDLIIIILLKVAIRLFPIKLLVVFSLSV